MNPALTEKIIRDVESLPEDKQLQVATFIQSLKDAGFKGMPGQEAVRLFAGLIDEKSAREMQAIIEDGCEKVDAEGW